MKLTHTDVGAAVMLDTRLTTIESDDYPGAGHTALGILLDSAGKPSCFCLFWEWGGDWTGFGDEDRADPDRLNGWEPDAVREAVDAAIAICPACADDMDWFLKWADDAESTLTDDDA